MEITGENIREIIDKFVKWEDAAVAGIEYVVENLI